MGILDDLTIIHTDRTAGGLVGKNGWLYMGFKGLVSWAGAQSVTPRPAQDHRRKGVI